MIGEHDRKQQTQSVRIGVDNRATIAECGRRRIRIEFLLQYGEIVDRRYVPRNVVGAVGAFDKSQDSVGHRPQRLSWFAYTNDAETSSNLLLSDNSFSASSYNVCSFRKPSKFDIETPPLA